MSQFPESGKIQGAYFKESIFQRCGHERREVKAGPQYGVDVALVTLPNGLDMALTSDPLSLIPTLGLRESAWLSVQLMANDMATTGIAPMYAQLVLNLPPDITAASFDQYWHWIHTYCTQIGVAITGGHTGKAEGQRSTLAGGGTMIAVAPTGSFLLSKYAQPGDTILVTKQSALIATSILALSFPRTVQNRCGMDTWQTACALFEETSSLKTGLVAAAGEDGDVHAMHDVTEGGLLGAIIEMAVASDCGVVVNNEQLPVGDVQQQIGGVFNMDPRWCVGAGSMILAVKGGKEQGVIQRLQEAGIPVVVAGGFTEQAAGMHLIENDQRQPLVHVGADPYWAAFYNAYSNHLP